MMDTIQKQKIGLCIGGTKSRQGGFTPLVIAGILAGDESKNMDKVTLVVEKPAYVIKHTKEYILYMLIDRKVKPFDRDSPGVLSVALTIARDRQLAEGKSPYSLLREAYDKFRSEYMRQGDDGFDSFINKDINQTDFITILEHYPLEKRSSVYIPMDPLGLAGKLCVPQEKMEDLFRDSQYREFAEFKEIEIGVDSSKTSSTKELVNIEIPRPIIYSIQVNGKPIEQTMRHPDDYYDSAWENTPYVKYEQVNFTLKQLLEEPEHQIRSSSGKSSATLDLEHACIVCKIHTEEIKYSLEYEILSDAREKREELAYLLLNKGVKLTIGGNVIEFSSASPKKTFIPASWAHQAVSYKAEPMVTFGFGVTSTVDDENKHVMVTITIHTPQRDPYSGGSSGYQGRKYDLNVPATTQIYSGERIENDHEEDLEELRSSHKQPSKKQPSKKTKKRWIPCAIWCFVGMCIGAVIVGAVWWFGGKLSYDESLQIAKEKVRTVPFEKIISIDEADTLETLRSLYKAIETKLRPQIEREVRNKIGEQKEAEEKAAKEAAAAKEAEEKAAKEAAAAKEAEKAKKLNNARQAIRLKLNETHNIGQCRAHTSWNDLTSEDQLAVEAVLNLGQYNRTIRKKVEDLLKKKEKYESWNDIIDTRKKILEIIDKSKK